jgi:hypothetical protein
MDSRILSGTMRRKIGIRTYPWATPAAIAETPTLPPPEDEDEDLPAAKKQRLQAPARENGVVNVHTAERVTTDSPDDTPTVPVTHTPATSLPRAAAPHAHRRNWYEEEDTKLIDAVKKHGKAWLAVAVLVPGRTNNQCRQRWTQTLGAGNRKKAGKWTPAEDTKLAEAVKKHGTTWLAVAALVGRTNIQCRGRWIQAVGPGNGKKSGAWTPEEDTKLIEVVKKHGTRWVVVANHVLGRTDKQCRGRWTDRLDPDCASNTVEEDPDRR